MHKKEIALSDGKVLTIYDDVYSFDDQVTFLTFFRHSLYKIDGSDHGVHDLNEQVYSLFSVQDVTNLGVINNGNFKKISDDFNLSNREIKQLRVNFGNPMDKNRIHTDQHGLTVLYYANLEWDIEWGGHTLFLDPTGKESEYLCLYKPSRVIVFDGTIPHLILNPTRVCPHNRYSFVMQFR